MICGRGLKIIFCAKRRKAMKHYKIKSKLSLTIILYTCKNYEILILYLKLKIRILYIKK